MSIGAWPIMRQPQNSQPVIPPLFRLRRRNNGICSLHTEQEPERRAGAIGLPVFKNTSQRGKIVHHAAMAFRFEDTIISKLSLRCRKSNFLIAEIDVTFAFRIRASQHRRKADGY